MKTIRKNYRKPKISQSNLKSFFFMNKSGSSNPNLFIADYSICADKGVVLAAERFLAHCC